MIEDIKFFDCIVKHQNLTKYGGISERITSHHQSLETHNYNPIYISRWIISTATNVRFFLAFSVLLLEMISVFNMDLDCNAVDKGETGQKFQHPQYEEAKQC